MKDKFIDGSEYMDLLMGAETDANVLYVVK